MMTNMELNKPTPIVTNNSFFSFTDRTDVAVTIKTLEEGQYVKINEFYRDGLTLSKALHSHLKQQLPNKTFKEQRAYRAAYHQLSNLILLEIVDQKLAVKKAPHIGWLEKLYP